MISVPVGVAGLLFAVAQYPPSPDTPLPGHALAGACEIRLDAPYVNPRLPLGRAAYAHRPACRTTWAPGSAGPGVYVQGPPVQVEGPPVGVGGLMIYLVPPEIMVLPSQLTVEQAQVHAADAETPEIAEPGSGD